MITPTLDVPVFARIRFPAWLQSLYNISQKECTTLDETGALCLVALPERIERIVISECRTLSVATESLVSSSYRCTGYNDV